MGGIPGKGKRLRVYKNESEKITDAFHASMEKTAMDEAKKPAARLWCKVACTTIAKRHCDSRIEAAKKHEPVRKACEGCQHFSEL